MMIKNTAQNNIGIITLNRPEKRNALHPEMVKSIKERLKVIKNDPDVKVLIITGEGNTFCAGADLEYLNQLKEYSSIDNEKDSRSLAEMFLMIYNFPKPVIAAVNGAAIAGGCGLASVCDLIVADKEYSKFGYSEVKIGFIPAIVSIFLIKRIGEGKANQLLLTGDVITGEEAYKLGLANYLKSDALSASTEIALKLLKNSQSSLISTKKMLKDISNLNVNDAVEHCINLNTISRGTEDFKDGLNNFLNKK